MPDPNASSNGSSRRMDGCRPSTALHDRRLARRPERRRLKRSEHGLGHLLPPVDDDADWITTRWEYALRLDLRMPSDEPEWFDVIAAGRLTVTTPHEQRAWATYNKSKRRTERVRPFNFAMTAHAKRLQRGSARTARALVAPLAQTIPERATTTWIDKHGPTAPLKARTDSGADHIPGTVAVLTYRDYFDEYRGRPEHKALGPDGERCHAWTRGILRPPIITATQLVRIGKETVNRRRRRPRPLPADQPRYHLRTADLPHLRQAARRQARLLLRRVSEEGSAKPRLSSSRAHARARGRPGAAGACVGCRKMRARRRLGGLGTPAERPVSSAEP